MQPSHKKQLHKNEPYEEAVHDLASVFRAAANGDFSKRVDVESAGGVIGKLSKDVNATLALIEDKVQGLQRCNIDLEHSLHDLKRHQKEIEREKVLEDAIISYLGEGMIVVDEAGFIIVINERAKDMLGLPLDRSVCGEHHSSLAVVTDRKGKRLTKTRHPIEYVLETKEKARITLSDDYFCRKQDGTIFPVMVTASPIMVGNSMRGVAAIFHDITKEKKIDEIKSDFISIASHQLRTPLTVMNLHTEMLLAGHGGELAPEQREYLSEIAFYNKKMTQLLNDFLVVSKIELGTFAIDSKPVDLRIIADSVLQEMRVGILHKKIRIRKEYDPDFPLIHTDPTLIKIVLQNLITNAIKYTPKEGHVTIALSRGKEDVVFAVTDTGIGIPEEEHGRIFTKLYRASNARKRDSDGSGLGLYIAKAITEKCNGTIWFESPAKNGRGKGSSFFVSLPASK